jgi:hypothetical protein
MRGVGRRRGAGGDEEDKDCEDNDRPFHKRYPGYFYHRSIKLTEFYDLLCASADFLPE